MIGSNEEPLHPERGRAILDDLIRQRRMLARSATEPGLLEANRLAIVYWQRQLAREADTSELAKG